MIDPKMVDDLKAALLPSHPAYWSAVQIVSLLHAMNHDSKGENPHELFYGLCLVAERAFPDRNPGHEEIVANPATPVLVQYLLSSLRRYHANVSGKELTTAKRAATVADALLMVGARERRLGKWGNAAREEYCSAFSSAHTVAREKGADLCMAYDAGITAAYALYRGTQRAQDESDRIKVVEKLRVLLEKNGYGTPPARGLKKT